MTTEHIEFLVEEPSMEELLRGVLPRILGPISSEIHTFQGKTGLVRNLPARLRGYASWLPSTYRIVVIVDRDDDDCRALKAQLDQVTADAGLMSKSRAGALPYQVLNRIAVEELEAWYFGDWEAVRAAFPAVSPNVPSKATYRYPDQIAGGTWEVFERELQRAGVYRGGLQKIDAARRIGAQMDPSRNRSPSFCALRDALASLADAATCAPEL